MDGAQPSLKLLSSPFLSPFLSPQSSDAVSSSTYRLISKLPKCLNSCSSSGCVSKPVSHLYKRLRRFYPIYSFSRTNAHKQLALPEYTETCLTAVYVHFRPHDPSHVYAHIHHEQYGPPGGYRTAGGFAPQQQGPPHGADPQYVTPLTAELCDT